MWQVRQHGCHLGRINDFSVPIKSWHRVYECCPFGECGVGPLGDVQIMDHLAGGAMGKVAANALAGSTAAQGGIHLVGGGHHICTHVDESAR